MNRATLFSVVVTAAAFVGAAGAADPKPAAPADKDGHKHADGDHKHDHKKDGKEEEHKGEKKDLGKLKVGTYEVQVTQVGDVKAGEEAIFVIKPKGEGEPKAVRAWVGVETGQGSIKTKAEEEKEGEWHAHHKVSKPMPAKSKLWIELETAAGKPKAAFDLK